MHNSDCHPLIVHKTVLEIADIITYPRGDMKFLFLYLQAAM